MTYEPVKRKVAIPNNVVSPTWSNEAPQPRIRARITSAAERPTLRSTKSNQSLRNDVRASSPAPPVPNGFLPNARAKVTAFVGGKRSPSPIPPTYGSSPSPPYASSSRTSPVARPPGPRSKSPALTRAKSPAFNASTRVNDGPRPPLPSAGYERSKTPTGFPSQEMSRAKSSGAKSVGEEKARVRVQATSITRAIPSRATSSPYDSFPSTPNGQSSVQLRRPSYSNRSSPGLTIPDQRMPKSPIDLHRLNPHVTTSLPPTPPLNPSLASSRSSARVMPANPYAHNPISPATPNSPEMRTVELPIATPIRGIDSLDLRKMSFDETSRSSFDSEWKSPSRPPNEYNRTQISPVHNQRQSVEVVLSAEAEEARINRKIADLEISNASLLAINRTLEANKAKQRSEINRLRGLLQEALSGTSLDGASHSVLFSGTNDLTDTELEGDLEDPALEERWGRMEELLGNMRRHGERCLEDLKAPVTGGSKRVLEWTDLDRPESPTEPLPELVDSPDVAELNDEASIDSD